MDQPLITEQIYDAPEDKVWQALANADQMREWYFPQLQAFEPRIGYKFVFSNDGSPYQKEWQVSQIKAGQLLVGILRRVTMSFRGKRSMYLAGGRVQQMLFQRFKVSY